MTINQDIDVTDNKRLSRKQLASQQAQFAAHLRRPDHHKAPSDIEDRRMAIYRDLFFNNIESFIASGFPIFKSLYTKAEWLSLVRDFFADHTCETPYFLAISEEFLDFVETSSHPLIERFPFAYELCHYEWVELALDIAEDTFDYQTIEANGELAHACIQLSPVAYLLDYQWPVHKIGADYIPDSPELSYLIVYRNRLDKVQFIQSNAATLRLLQLLSENVEDLNLSDSPVDLPSNANAFLTTHQALRQLAIELSADADNQSIYQFGLQTLESLREQGVILGTRCAEL